MRLFVLIVVAVLLLALGGLEAASSRVPPVADPLPTAVEFEPDYWP